MARSWFITARVDGLTHKSKSTGSYHFHIENETSPVVESRAVPYSKISASDMIHFVP